MKVRAAPRKESGWRLSVRNTAGMKDASLVDLRLLSQRRSTSYAVRTDMRLEEHFESDSTLQRNERVQLAASFWNTLSPNAMPSAGNSSGPIGPVAVLDR